MRLIKITLILFLLTVLNPLFCQNFYGGISLGGVFSQVDGDNYGGYHKFSPLGGIYVRNTFNNSNNEFSLGIEYKRKGSKEVQKDDWGNVVLYYSMNLDYIEIPALVSFKINKIKFPGIINYKFNKDFLFDVGLSFAYLVQAYEENLSGRLDPEYGRKFRNYEIAHQFGLTYRFSKHFHFSWRFSYTNFLLPIRKHPGGQIYWFNRGQYNHNQSLIFRYEF